MLLFILSVGAVSANGDFVNESLSVDDSFLDVNSIQTFDDSINIGSFDDLQNVINNASDDSIIYLDKDYNGCENSKIVLNKNLIIDGQGHKIDCLAKKNCFVFYSESGQITLRNLIITNSRNYCSDMGGAVFITGSAQYFIENCTFMNNWADIFGGAIYNNASNPLSISDSKFISNKVLDEGCGGAIYSKGIVNIMDCVFDTNSAYECGGAVFCEKDVNVIGCLFEKNSCSSMESNGGAIYSIATVSINNSTFRNNRAMKNGGAVHSNSVKIDSCSSFENNHAFNGDGGALYVKHSDIKNTSFINNMALNNGGAIYCENDLTVNKASFMFNSVEVNGGAIYCIKNAVIRGCVFESNTAYSMFKGSNGGAVFVQYDASVDSSVFIGNYAENDGGALFSLGCWIGNSLFENNYAAGNGGAVGSEYCKYYRTIISSSYFISNKANCGGAIDTSDLLLDSSYFVNNSATKGGAVHSQEIRITSTCFDGNSADYGGAIFTNEFIENYPNSEFDNIRFINNHAVFGGALYLDRTINTVFSGCVFTNNTADDGGAIYNQFTVNVKNCSFLSNYAKNCGGAIFNQEKIIVDLSSFVGNYAGHDGGAVYSKKNAVIRPFSYFESNIAYNGDGGAVFTDYFDSDIENLIFINNTAGSFGGAVYINKLNKNILYSKFLTNHANMGCAVYVENLLEDKSVRGSTFINNTAENQGKYFGSYYEVVVNKDVVHNPEYDEYMRNLDDSWWDSVVDSMFGGRPSENICVKLDFYDIHHFMDINYKIEDSIYLNTPFKVTFYIDDDAPDGEYGWSAFVMNNLLFDIDSSIVVVSKEVGKNFVTLELTLTDIFYKPIGVDFYGCHLSIDTPYMIKYPDHDWNIIDMPPISKGHC